MTYFNTYYNQKKLMNETEEEFGYDDYIKPPKPRAIAPVEPDIVLEKPGNDLPRYLNDMIIKPAKLQPVQIKVDSIIIKGSKILATHPKSSLVDGSIYLMAKAFFYRSEWLPSAIKCMELAEQFPDSPYSPDAHLLASKNYLIQRNLPKAKIMLSRTVDIAWQQQRYDVLSEAFQLMAEEAMVQGDFDGAQRPYRQAILQCTDDEQRARWQTDLGLLLYRTRQFSKAEAALAQVHTYTPSVLNEFEAYLYRVLSLAELGRYSEARFALLQLENNRNYDEYVKMGYTSAAMHQICRLEGNKEALAGIERHIDSTGLTGPILHVAYFARGMELFRSKDYPGAQRYFARAKVSRSAVFDGANNLFNLLNIREQKLQESDAIFRGVMEHKDSTKFQLDSTARLYGKTLFELGRAHELLGNADSAEFYYKTAMEAAPQKDTARAQYLYSYARMVDGRDKALADSVHEMIFAQYLSTPFGAESRVRLGYTDYAVSDSVEAIFRSGSRFRSVGDYSMAMRQYHRIVENHSASSFAPPSMYALGWVWENKLRNNDSALHYYSLLVKRYPFSEYADDVRYSVAVGVSNRSGKGDTTLWGPVRKPGEGTPASPASPADSLGTTSAPPPAPSTPAKQQNAEPSISLPIPMAKPALQDFNTNPQLVIPQQSIDTTVSTPPADSVVKKPK
ncbi:MAG: tetratricopeptide repeat protein [Candidatus Kapaibacterium sp.]|jgi:tetratricopeptide (TPR) repeat protein